jgi:hypothetical protein
LTTTAVEPTSNNVDKEADAEYGPVVTTSRRTLEEGAVKFDTNVVTLAIADEIEETVSSLVQSLLRLQCKTRQLCCNGAQLTRLQANLVCHFARLIRNIATLVYNSPALRTLYKEKQGRKRTAFVPHAVITPQELSLALLLHMLGRGFYYEDCCAHVVALWSPNVWLCELYGGDNQTIISQVLAERGRAARHKKLAALYDREKIDRTAVRIGDCLAHYQDHAFWTRNFILTH